MVGCLGSCCARAASGQAAVPPTNVMKSRRLIAFLEGCGLRRLQFDYSKDLRQAKWGSGIKLHSSNSELPMSALGHKRTFTHLRSMSALPPIADIMECDWHVRLCQKRTFTKKPEPVHPWFDRS